MAVSIFLSFNHTSAGTPAVIPQPESISSSGNMLPVSKKITLSVESPRNVAKSLPPASFISEMTGLDIRYGKKSRLKSSCEPESYTLYINGNKAHLQAADYNGFIYGLHTLSQILSTSDSITERITVTDTPRCTWRASMLDSGRQKQSIEKILALIRMASRLKMNRFHWHLTEGLGWRPEIKAFPMLTAKGAFVGKEPEQQGYYSREDMRKVVEYASQWGVEIVPEIDLPGHSEAALNAYPELGCFGTVPDVPAQGFTENIFCAGKDRTVEALTTIIDEICDIFHGQYIHLGGDEAPKANWEKCPDCQARIQQHGLKGTHDLQLWLSAQLASHLEAKGRKAIFWGDAVYSNDGTPLPKNSVIQWWNYRGHGDLAVRNALERDMQVILSPNYYCYINFPEEPWKGYGPERTFNLEKAYTANPADSVLARGDKRILGMTCALWTDYNLTEQMLDLRLFPRIFALSELMWHKGPRKPLAEFQSDIDRLTPMFKN